MSAASIVFVPGSFTVPELYSDVLDALTARGYDVHGVHLRTALARNDEPPRGRPSPSMYDDAAVIAAKVKELADQGKDVVVFAHSYSGTPCSESLKVLSKAHRQEQGLHGGVVRLAFATCLVGEVGQSAGECLKMKKGDKLPAELNVS
jgi:hypothetical protein